MVLTAVTRGKRPRSVLIIVLIISLTAVTSLSSSSMDSFIFGGCSQLKYSPGSSYESNVNSMLTSIVNSAAMSSYNNFTITNPFVQTTSSSHDKVYGLYQCRGDLTAPDCAACVSHAVSQVGLLCIDAAGAALQLGGCFVKYDNTTFLGAEDETVLFQKCGPSAGFDSGELTQRDSLLSFLAGTGGYFRVGSLGRLQGLAQCVGDLNVGQCQDCVSDAIERLRTECGTAFWGDMFLGKCYVRFGDGRGDHSKAHAGRNDPNSNDDEIEKTLTILIGLIAGVAVLVVFISILTKGCEKKGGK